jgi:hypothetical protein
VRHPAGSRWEVFKQLVFRTYGDNCWICTHGGARQIDHVESVTEHPEQAWELRNCRPAHGSPRNPCPVCSAAAGGRRIYCNQLRGSGSIERARRIIAERIAERKPGLSPQRIRPESTAADPPRQREIPDPQAGRDW